MQPLLFTIALFAGFAAAQSGDQAMEQNATCLLLLNKGDASVSLFDPIGRRETERIAVGQRPNALAVSQNGRLAAVRCRGSSPSRDTLTLIEIPSAKSLGTYPIDDGNPVKDLAETDDRGPPQALHFLPGDRQILVADAPAQQLLLFDLDHKAVVRTIPTKGMSPYQLAVSGNGHQAFTTNLACEALTVVDLCEGSKQPTRVIQTGAGSTDLAICPTDGLAWLANEATEMVHIFDPDAGQRTASIELPAAPTKLTFTPDGSMALTTCSGAGEVLVFDTRKKTLRKRIELTGDNSEVSCLPVAICVEPGGQYAWVGCTRGEFLAILDLATGELVDRIPTRPGPGPMAFATPR